MPARAWSRPSSNRTTRCWTPGCAATRSPLEALQAGLRAGTLAGAFVPVLAGSAFKNRGVEPLLDAVVDYLPRPGRDES